MPDIRRLLFPALAAPVLVIFIRLLLISLSAGSPLSPWLMISVMAAVTLLVYGRLELVLLMALNTAFLAGGGALLARAGHPAPWLVPYLFDGMALLALGGYLAHYRYGRRFSFRTLAGLAAPYLPLMIPAAAAALGLSGVPPEALIPAAAAGIPLAALSTALTLLLLKRAIGNREEAGRPPLTLFPGNPDGLRAPWYYKGAVIEVYLAVKLKFEEGYRLVDRLVPKTGDILDIGCGYGFMIRMLKRQSAGRRFTGIDHDGEKIRVASGCRLHSEDLRFEQADALTWLSPRQYDAVMIFDMLHYLTEENQERLLLKYMDKINPGGLLIVREGDPALTGRHRWNRLAEFFSTRILRFNKLAARGLHFVSREFYSRVAEKGGFRITELIEDAAKTSNIYLVMVNHGGGEDEGI